MAVEQNAQKTLFDALYCQDEKWVELEDDIDDEQEQEKVNDYDSEITLNRRSLLPILLLEQDLFWDDEELQSLFLKEKETRFNLKETSLIHSLARKEAVEWILKTNAHYGFSALSAVLAANYLDRFVSSMSFQPDKPWMMQLVAVTCLSLAAKVEEICVPLLLDLQIEGGAKYVFEAETIQRMELLVLSTLKWRMNPLTPLSFVDHLVRRIGLISHTHWEFLRHCESLLLSVISDSRFMRYLPSVIATATMLQVIHQVIEPCDATDYENQLLGVLKICKEEVDDCCNLITDKLITDNKKRTLRQLTNSPSGVMDACFSSDDSSNDSWEVVNRSSLLFHFNKKRRVQEQQMKLPCRVVVDAITNS